jgi:hypothetical protein
MFWFIRMYVNEKLIYIGSSLRRNEKFFQACMVVGPFHTGNFQSWMKEGSRNEASFCEGFHEGDLEIGYFY